MLSDGTFYLTVYCTNVFGSTTHEFTLQSGPATVTDINFNDTVTNDDPTRVGWRFYRVNTPVSLGWDLFLTNFAPGTRIALRRNAAPSLWSYRPPPTGSQANYYDVMSAADFLQQPGLQADWWYIGVYNRSSALGPFTLITRELQAAPLADNTLTLRSNVLNGRWEFFRVQLAPEDLQGTNGVGPVLGWDVRLVNVTAGSPRLVVRREALPTTLSSTFSTSGSSWPSGGQWVANQDWTKRSLAASGTNEDGRILAMGVGRPLEAATYYIGVLNNTGSTSNMTYNILSRWIGPGRSIPVQDLTWDSSRVTNTVAPREAAYYRLMLPNGAPSWKVRMTPSAGEAMLVANSTPLPTVDSEKRMQKLGKEYYLRLPNPGTNILLPGTNFLTVVGEGLNPADSTHIGSGTTTFVLETLGPMPEPDLGTLSPANDLLVNAALDGGESAAYHFHSDVTCLGFWITLENVTGNPWAVSRGTMALADPGLGADTYGDEGGQSDLAVASPSMIIVANPTTDQTVMVKARQSAGSYPDSTYTLRVKQIVPQTLTFDGGTSDIVNWPAAYESFFTVDVPPGALGWDLRLTNVTSGSPLLVVSRDALPIASSSAGFNPSPFASTNWPSAARWAAGVDWTERPNSPTGASESGRILAMGMGQPLQPGRYYVGVMSGGGPVSCTVVSRGIGPGYSIPVTNLDAATGQSVISNLPAREAAYYRVNLTNNAASWRVRLSATNGESLLIVLKDSLPNVGALLTSSVTNSGGHKMQKQGDEQYLLLPSAGQDRLTPGCYYLAVVSEGQNATNLTRIGTATSSATLSCVGEVPPTYLGDVGAGELADTNSLLGGDTRFYQFNVPAGIQTLQAILENPTGNPVMDLRVGTRLPDPGASGAGIPLDPYGDDGGEPAGNLVNASLLSLSNPTNGLYTLAVKARATPGVQGIISNATYTLRINVPGSGPATQVTPVNFDLGSSTVTNQAPGTWRYFQVIVPTNAPGWDVRLTDVTSGLPRLVVRRESIPTNLTTTPWGTPGTAIAWPTNYQWAPTADWTRRTYSVDGTVSEDGRIMAAGLYKPLEAGTYYIGVINSAATTNMSYTLLSRGIGPGFAIPLLDLPFVGSLANDSLPARNAAYYRVVIPTNTPSWKLNVKASAGECMLAGLRNALPDTDTINANGTLANGKSMQRLGDEQFMLLPTAGQTNIPAATNFFAVISEGVNPGTSSRIGPGSCSYVINSLGAVPVLDLGLVTSEDIIQPDNLQGGESKAYQFEVAWGTYGVKVHLEGRVNNPVVVALPGTMLPDPGASVAGLSSDSYGNEGGYAPADGHSAILTLPNPVVGPYSLMVKARAVSGNYPDASYTLRLEEVLAPELNFSSELNTNGLSNQASDLLEDNERAFYKIVVPSTLNGQPVIGWKLDLSQSAGSATMRVRRDLLPSDANASSQMAFTAASAIIAPPYLTNGVWFVEVKATGSTSFTLRSSALYLERPAWVMPAPGETNATPGVALPTFGDTGIDTNGLALSGDQSIFLEQGSLDYYAVQVSGTNQGLLRAQLEAISGNPDLYLRVGAVPTLYHSISGGPGTVYDRSMLAPTYTEYANWVPLDGKVETQLKPGLWYLAVRAASNANARYRLRVSLGSITDLPIQGPSLTNQIVAGGDWRFYRVPMPTALPLSFNVTFSQEAGDAVMYLRDSLPPGNGITGGSSDYKDWKSDAKNYGPYQNYDVPATYTFTAPPVRPGQAIYLGFRAVSDATFSVKVTTNGLPVSDPCVVPFYGGVATTNVAGYSAAIFRVDVPPEATRWKHSSTHATNLVVYLDQGSIPARTGTRWTGSTANSSYSTALVVWNDSLKQYLPAAWPWVARQSYYLLVTNVTAIPQDFTLMMDGKNALTDDTDTDALPDAWELLYFGNLGQVAAGDPDHDGISNLDEHNEGTNPNDPNSYRARLFATGINGTVARQPDLPSYPLGSSVVLTPSPVSGYAFIAWSGQASGSANPLTLLMDGHKTLTATFKLAGDDFSTALPITGNSATLHGTNISFTKETSEPNHAGNPGGKSIWWRWTAPASGPVTLNTAGSAFTTLLAVYSGTTVSSLTCLGSDIDSLGGTNRSHVAFNAMAGQTYNIAVDGKDGASGRITLTLSTSSVVAPLWLAQLSRFTDGTVQLTISGEANRTYQVDVSSNLTTWTSLASVTTASDGTATFFDLAAAGAKGRFYRAHY